MENGALLPEVEGVAAAQARPARVHRTKQHVPLRLGNARPAWLSG